MSELSEEEIIKILQKIAEDEQEFYNTDSIIQRTAMQGLLDLYQKEKEKNKEYENKIKSVLELIDTKPYTAYTLYGDILYDDENIRELLEERN